MLDGTSIDGNSALDLVRDNGLTAVVIDDFVLAPALLEAARRRGVAVPEDLSLAQLGDPVVGRTDEHWTGFRIPREEMGAHALRILRGIIDGSLGES
jgi:DNA-binding LacI/PurR family transcriptional regulator